MRTRFSGNEGGKAGRPDHVAECQHLSATDKTKKQPWKNEASFLHCLKIVV
jgi:hypothetical protein